MQTQRRGATQGGNVASSTCPNLDEGAEIRPPGDHNIWSPLHPRSPLRALRLANSGRAFGRLMPPVVAKAVSQSPQGKWRPRGAVSICLGDIPPVASEAELLTGAPCSQGLRRRGPCRTPTPPMPKPAVGGRVSAGRREKAESP